jgi:hypothetical protein
MKRSIKRGVLSLLILSTSPAPPFMPEYSKYQQKVIKNYYDNQETILLQKLGEYVTELYLAEGKAREKRWKTVVTTLEKLKVPAPRIKTLQDSDNPALVAKLLEELLAKAK